MWGTLGTYKYTIQLNFVDKAESYYRSTVLRFTINRNHT